MTGETLVVFTPQHNQPPVTNYATVGFRNVGSPHQFLDFDAVTQEIAVFAAKMPRNYAGGNVTIYLTWVTTAVVGTGAWDVAFERNADGGLDLDADGWGSAQIVAAVTVPATAGVPYVSSVTVAAGVAGTSSIAAGDDFRIRIRRRVDLDTAASDLQLLSVEIKEA